MHGSSPGAARRQRQKWNKISTIATGGTFSRVCYLQPIRTIGPKYAQTKEGNPVTRRNEHFQNVLVITAVLQFERPKADASANWHRKHREGMNVRHQERKVEGTNYYCSLSYEYFAHFHFREKQKYSKKEKEKKRRLLELLH